MPAPLFDVPDARAGSAWLSSEGRTRPSELLVALLSRFNHDLRTPLNTVVGWTHLLQQGMVDSTRSKHVADVLSRNTREQVVMLDEFVDDARAVLGALKLDATALGVDELVAQATERAAPVATLNSVTFDVRLDDGVGPVEGDERRLKRLVYRLLAAVTRRTREGGVVRVASRGDDHGVLLTIEGPAGARDWPEATLLDLQLGSFVAALHDAELALDGAPERAGLALRLPRRP